MAGPKGIAQASQASQTEQRKKQIFEQPITKALDQYKTDKYGKSASESFEKFAQTREGRLAIAEVRRGLPQTRVQGIGKPAAEERLNRQAEQIVRDRYVTTYQNSAFNKDGKGTAGRGSTAGASSSPTAAKTEFPKPSTEALPPGLEGEVNQRDRTETVGTSTKQFFNLNSFLSEVLSQDVLPSHSYIVTFAPFRTGFGENEPLTNFVTNKRSTLVMRCENVILPTPSLLEEENIRRYGYGPVEKVPYGVQFSDVSMTWLVDSKSEIIDFMHQWMNTIVMHDSPNANMAQNVQQDGFRDKLGAYFPFEVGYKDAYTNPVVRIYVYNRQQEVVTEYELFDVFPMNIQSMNLAWADENQIQKLTVNFAYVNMRVKAPKKVKGQVTYDNIEALASPYEERQQPSDKGGKAAADRADSPVGESPRRTVNASNPAIRQAVLDIPAQASKPLPTIRSL